MVGLALLLAGVTLASAARAQTADPPEIVGRLVGPGASPAEPDLKLYGTDLGWTYEHEGQLFMLFGDPGMRLDRPPSTQARETH